MSKDNEKKIKWTSKAPDLSFIEQTLKEYLEVVETSKKELIKKKAALIRALKENKK